MKALRIQATAQILTLPEGTVTQIVPVVSGDTRPTIPVQWFDDTGAVINITGTTPRMRLRLRGDTKVLNPLAADNALTIDDAVNGKCHYMFKAADLATPGILEGQLQLDYGAGDVWTMPEPLLFEVRRKF